jgi:hypothetical protein
MSCHDNRTHSVTDVTLLRPQCLTLHAKLSHAGTSFSPCRPDTHSTTLHALAETYPARAKRLPLPCLNIKTHIS